MRPINLIPEEERRRSRRDRSSSGSPLPYLLVGALAIGLIGVVMLVLISNTISDRESEVTALQAERAAATARADSLTPYASFQDVAEQRTQTVAGLADSRFDWARVIKQLALTLPKNVYFTSLSGSAGGGEGGAEGISGPSLTIAGCAPGQNAVAGFVASLKEIDGVTRVELKQSQVAEAGAGGATGASACSVGRKAQFQIIVAFDEAPPSPDSSAGQLEATEAESSAEGTESSATGAEGSSESEGSSGEPESGGETALPESASASTAGVGEGTG
jgi:Tfp pilus assembly protein PilN